MDTTLQLGSLTAHRPSSPAVTTFLQRKFVVAGTGHRPDKLGGYSAEADALLSDLAREYLTRLQPDVVISGMAPGWDLALAQAALDLQLPFVAAIPFPKQASRWPRASQERHQALLTQAALIVCVGSDQLADADIRAAMNWRNEFMVDHASVILACFDSSAGGTKNCVTDAETQGKSVINTYLTWQARTSTPSTTDLAFPPVTHPEFGEGTVRSETTLRAEAAFIVDFGDQHTAILTAASLQPAQVNQAAQQVTHPKFGPGTQIHTSHRAGQDYADVQFPDQLRTVLSTTLTPA